MSEENENDIPDMAAAMGVADEMGQGDIDALLGDEGVNNVPEFGTILEEMIYRSELNYEPLPMLDVITERLVMSLSTSLKAHTSAAVDVSMKSLEYVSYANAMGRINIPSLLYIVQCDPWDTNLVVSTDAKLLYSAVEIMLGGAGSSALKTEGRSFTALERDIGSGLSRVILDDFSEAFSQLANVDFSVVSTETNPQFASIARPNSPAIQISLEVTLNGRSGEVEIVIPYATVDPIRKTLSKVFLGEKLGGDKIWRRQISGKLEDADVEVKAVYHRFKTSLNDILSWEVGDTIDMLIGPEQKTGIYCSGEKVMEGYFGKGHAHLAVRITDTFKKKDDVDVD